MSKIWISGLLDIWIFGFLGFWIFGFAPKLDSEKQGVCTGIHSVFKGSACRGGGDHIYMYEYRYVYIYIYTCRPACVHMYTYIYIYMVAPPIDPYFLASTTYSGRIPSASHEKSSLWVQGYITSLGHTRKRAPLNVHAAPKFLGHLG